MKFDDNNAFLRFLEDLPKGTKVTWKYFSSGGTFDAKDLLKVNRFFNLQDWNSFEVDVTEKIQQRRGNNGKQISE